MTLPLPVRRSILLILALAAATLALLALRGAPASAAGSQVLHLSAKANMLRFSTSHLSAHRGRITIVMHNPSNAGMKHGISIEGRGIDRDGPIVSPGHNSELTVTLTKKGTYEYFCPVPGHRQAGMTGTLTVS
jgi:plastocyanin